VQPTTFLFESGFFIKKGGILVQIGSLSNYKTVLHYSLTHPGKSNFETLRLATKEFMSAPPSRTIRSEDEKGKEKNTESEMNLTKKDYVIRQMEADLSNVKDFSTDSMLNNGKNAKQLGNFLFDKSFYPSNSGRYIDIYV
jgi:hypothetical protein